MWWTSFSAHKDLLFGVLNQYGFEANLSITFSGEIAHLNVDFKDESFPGLKCEGKNMKSIADKFEKYVLKICKKIEKTHN